MKKIVGGPCTASGMSLKVGHCGFAAASIGVMAFSRGFSGYAAFCYLIASMGLQLLWSFGLACLDIYALRRKRDLHNPVLLSLFVVGDWVNTLIAFLTGSVCIGLIPSYLWVTATLSLAAACSSAGVVILYARDLNICAAQPVLPSAKFQIAVAFSFLTWGLIAILSHVMFWTLASI